jgi:thiamine biosynthesis lipoprotein
MGIRDPRDSQALMASIPMIGGALATSGDYERFFEQDGVRYCHILDPLTGRPVSYYRSVSVLAENAITAGSYSTIGMLMSNPQQFFVGKSIKFLLIDAGNNVIFG